MAPPISRVYEDDEEVRRVVILFKRHCLSIVGFVAWISTLVSTNSVLRAEDVEFLRSLDLDSRDKVGVIYNLERDYHEANFPFLLEHGVPIHRITTARMREDWQFMRVHQEVWMEVEEVLRSSTHGRLTFSNLPSYYRWADDWSRSDWYFQNQRAGRLGEKICRFEAGAEIGAIESHLHGTQRTVRPGAARAYWERFGANTMNLGKPPLARNRRSMHSVDLSDFGTVLDDEDTIELEAFFDKTSIRGKQRPQSGQSLPPASGLEIYESPSSTAFEGSLIALTVHGFDGIFQILSVEGADVDMNAFLAEGPHSLEIDIIVTMPHS
ncbi:hypothetical protein K438DRAFT_1967622 [Mycena galopus ATCC 62051]|nr:hypothetical protein K438DRAFT_1967622 [Mycena galopus ATCC 62051]